MDRADVDKILPEFAQTFVRAWRQSDDDDGMQITVTKQLLNVLGDTLDDHVHSSINVVRLSWRSDMVQDRIYYWLSYVVLVLYSRTPGYESQMYDLMRHKLNQNCSQLLSYVTTKHLDAPPSVSDTTTAATTTTLLSPLGLARFVAHSVMAGTIPAVYTHPWLWRVFIFSKQSLLARFVIQVI